MAELGERTEAPTSRRLSEARGKGQIPKSQDLTGVLSLAAAAVALALTGGFIVGRMAELLRGFLPGGSPVAAGLSAMDELRSATIDTLAVTLPVMGIMTLGILAATLAQTGLVFTTTPLAPDLKRLSPIAGFKRIFGLRGVIKTGMSVVKLAVVVAAAGLVIHGRQAELAMLAVLDPIPSALVTLRVLAEVLACVLILMLVIALADLLYQRWQHRHDLRMTKQEIKDELKSMEGDPDMKRRRLRIAQEIAFQRVRRDVPEADVIVTNPTHFSVAIRYEDGARAPRVTAKGADHLAFRIREIAVAAGVPIIERPPLARALYWGVEPGEEIAPEHYEAVAEILAFVYQLDGSAGERRRREPLAGSAV